MRFSATITTTATAILVASASARSLDSRNNRSTCNHSNLNTSISSYTVTAKDTIFSIAAATKRGVCDIARYNHLPTADLIYAGEVLAIPPQVCNPDNTSCLLVDMKPTRACILGGPHTYTLVTSESISYIARYKLNITVDSLFNSSSRMLASGATAETLLAAGQTLKVPQCSPSLCEIEPYQLGNETYKDIADRIGTTVGQILGFNPQYNHSSPSGQPVISVPMRCKLLSNDYTVIS